REFLAATALPVTWACLDVAGPVIDGRAKVTNLSWDLDEAGLADALNLRMVHLFNDLEAVARSVPELIPEDLAALNVGEPVDQGAVAVIAPGTGLGEAFLIWDGSGTARSTLKAVTPSSRRRPTMRWVYSPVCSNGVTT